MLEKFLVYGANGTQGSAVVRALLARDKRVRVLARDPSRSAFAADRRVEVVAGDLDDAASLQRASSGVSGVYLMMPLSFDHPRVGRWARSAIDAASDSSASVLVFNASGLVPDAAVGIPTLDKKREIEAYLQAARIPSISLRGTLYLGNLGAPWSAPLIVHQGVVAYPLPAEQRVSWLSWEEAAAYAVAAFERPDLAARRAVLQLGGAQALTGAELARGIARAEEAGRVPAAAAAPARSWAQPALRCSRRKGARRLLWLARRAARAQPARRRHFCRTRRAPHPATALRGLGARVPLDLAGRSCNMMDGMSITPVRVPAEAAAVVDFWKEAGPKMWFAKDDDFDRLFRERFQALYERAARGELDAWLDSAQSALALILLLDQYPRNSFRGTPRMYATDALGVHHASHAIARGYDRQVEEEMQFFFYLPLGHSESLADQERCVALNQRFGPEMLKHAVEHCDIVRRFGRFPHRNPILGRPSSEAELEFLKQGGFAG